VDNYAIIRSLTFPAVAPTLGINLSKFKVRKNGQEHYGPCPVHQPKNNQTSFSYLNDGRFNCFSCGAKGRGALDLTKAVRQIGFKEAVALLEPLARPETIQRLAKGKSPNLGHPSANGVEDVGRDGAVHDEPSSSTRDDTASPVVLRPFQGQYYKFAVKCPWLESRVPDSEIRELYGAFQYSNPSRKSAWSGRVMLPVRDVEGILYGYLGRSIHDNSDCPTDTPTPKYLFPKNLPKSRLVLGGVVVKRVFLVESPFAVMRFASMGIPAVSSFGWVASPEQIEILATLTRGCIYLPDRNKHDAASEHVARLAASLWVRFPSLPDGIDDPEHLSLEQIQNLTR
jgi:DNA primase